MPYGALSGGAAVYVVDTVGALVGGRWLLSISGDFKCLALWGFESKKIICVRCLQSISCSDCKITHPQPHTHVY